MSKRSYYLLVVFAASFMGGLVDQNVLPAPYQGLAVALAVALSMLTKVPEFDRLKDETQG